MEALPGSLYLPGETEGLVAAAQREEQKLQSANFPVVGQSRRRLKGTPWKIFQAKGTYSLFNS